MPSCLLSALNVNRSVTVNSIGAGSNVGTVANTISTTFTITVVDGVNRRLYVGFIAGHITWVNPTMTASSSIDGALTTVSELEYGDAGGGFRAGKTSVLRLNNPSIGTHTITIQATASQNLASLGGMAICLNNAGTEGTPATQAQTGRSGALSLSVTSAIGDEALCFFGCSSATPTLSVGMPTPFSTQQPGGADAKYIGGFKVDGAGSSFTFGTSSSDHKVGGIAFNVAKA